MPRLRRLIIPIVTLALTPALPALDIDNPPVGVFSDEWYALMIQGRKSGHMHATLERVKTTSGDVIRSKSTMVLSAGRSDQSITVSVASQSEETIDGKPLSFTNTQKLGFIPKTVSGRFKDGKVIITSGQFGQTSQPRTYDMPEGALMSWALYREQVKRGLKPGTKYSLLMYDPMTAEDRAIRATVEIFDKERLDLFGRTVEAVRTRQTVSLKTFLGEVPVETTTWIRPDGETVKMEMSMMGIPFEMLACSKPVALAKDDPSDLMDQTLVTVRDRIDPSVDTIRYRITGTGQGDHSVAEIPQTSMQRVEGRDNGAILLRVTRLSAARRPATQPAELTEPERKLYLAATPILDYTDPEVARLVKQAAGDEKDPRRLISRLREFVSEYIEKKSLGVGFATAGEVARSREGDCTEHGVLLAALGRGVGIPSRLATGLVYTDEFNGRRNVFVGHLWTQFFIDGQWIDQDPALRQGDLDPTHITLSVNPASDTGVADLVGSLWLTMGQLKIEVVKGAPATAPERHDNP